MVTSGRLVKSARVFDKKKLGMFSINEERNYEVFRYLCTIVLICQCFKNLKNFQITEGKRQAQCTPRRPRMGVGASHGSSGIGNALLPPNHFGMGGSDGPRFALRMCAWRAALRPHRLRLSRCTSISNAILSLRRARLFDNSDSLCGSVAIL